MNRVAMALGLAVFSLACSGEISPNIVITQTDWQTPANEGDMESRQVDLLGRVDRLDERQLGSATQRTQHQRLVLHRLRPVIR